MPLFVDEQIKDLEIEVSEGENYALRLASFSSFPNAKIHVKVQNNGVFDGAFADFSSGKGTFDIVVELLGEGAKSTWRYAGISSGNSNKNVTCSVEHLAPSTEAEVAQNGIATEKGKLSFLGTSHIHKGMAASSTSQKAKIIVFDPEAFGKCMPVLRIDENDVSASHSAIVGKLSEEQLFYLLSRGIDRDSAKRLMTLGHLKPILAHFNEATSSRIQNRIEEGILHV